jgi:4-amino-4-deoxy-L-arabinose transferase-like glycosyltransferase
VSERRFAPALTAIAVAGLLVRWWYLVASKVDDIPVIRQGDAFWYATTAQALARGELFRNNFDGLPTADHPPLTVLVITPAAALFDDSVFAQRLTMMALGVAVIVVVGLLGRRLAGPRVGLLAAGLAAISPALWVNDVLIMSETVTALLVAFVLWAGLVLAERPSNRSALVAGLLCGLLGLARAETALFLPLMVWPIVAVAPGLRWTRRLGLGAIATAGAVVALAPWMLLNVGRFEEPVLISTNDGLTLAGANCDATYQGEAKGGWVIDPCVLEGYATLDAAKPGDAPPAPFGDDPCTDTLQRRLPCRDPSEISKVLRAQGLEYISEHATELPGVILARNGRVWGIYAQDQSATTGILEGREPWATRAGFAFTWLLLPFAIAGMVLLKRRGTTLAPFLASLAIVILATSAFTGLVGRFRVPWDVAACLLAAVAISALIDRWRPTRAAEPTDGPHATRAAPQG